MNTALRGLIGLGTIGGVVGGGYMAQSYFFTEDIESKLKANKYEILDKSSAEWEEIVKSYKTVVSNNKDLQIDDFDGTDPTGTQPKRKAKDILSEKCHKIIKEKASNNADYKKAEKWCIKPLTVKDKLTATALDTTANKNEQDTKWKQRLNEHKVGKNNQIEAIKAQGFESKREEEKLKAIKAECAKLIAKKTYEADFDTSLTQANLWCVDKP